VTFHGEGGREPMPARPCGQDSEACSAPQPFPEQRQQANAYRPPTTNVPHHLARHSARHFLSIFAHYTANFVMIILFSIAYEGWSTHSLGVVLTARQPNAARRYEGLKCCQCAAYAVRGPKYRIPHTRSYRCSVMTKTLPQYGVRGAVSLIDPLINEV
jgi:hypothetical protein